MAPSILVVLALLIYPVLSSIWYSFTDKHLLRHGYEFVGLSNYADLLVSPDYWNAFGVSLKWTAASILGQLLVGMALALALDSVPRDEGMHLCCARVTCASVDSLCCTPETTITLCQLYWS